MKTITFYEELVEQYLQVSVTPPYQEISKIDKHINFYLADQKNQLVTVHEQGGRYILDFDIRSAFPTICTNLFGQDSEFVQKMNSIDEKKGKNIFIATGLKDTGYLKQLNSICKMIVMGILFDSHDLNEKNEIFLFELKKDSCGFSCNETTLNRLMNLEDSNNEFTNFILSKGFNFHSTRYKIYVRANKTSFFIDDSNKLHIKGQYKHIPYELKRILEETFLTDNINHRLLSKIYSDKYWKIIKYNNLNTNLKKYYICDNDKIIDFQGRYCKLTESITVDPKIYMKIFLYPTILSNKLK